MVEFSYEADMKVQRDEAEKRGERNTLFSLVKDKLLDEKEAAIRLDITMEQFQNSYNEWLEKKFCKSHPGLMAYYSDEIAICLISSMKRNAAGFR